MQKGDARRTRGWGLRRRSTCDSMPATRARRYRMRDRRSWSHTEASACSACIAFLHLRWILFCAAAPRRPRRTPSRQVAENSSHAAVISKVSSADNSAQFICMGHAFDREARVVRLGALLLLSRSCALTDHSSRCYLRVLRASPSCICARILALQCCQQAIADVLPHRRLSRCSEHCKRWDQAYRDRPALPSNDNNTSTEWSAYSTLLEGGMDFPLASWLETVHPVRCNRSKSLCRGTS